MRILRDFKMPDFKFPKMKMEGMEDIEEMQINYDQIEKMKDKKFKNKFYEETHYTDVKEIFKRSIEKYKNNIYILERPEHDHKAKFEEFTYERFGNDVINLGTGLIKHLNLKGERIIIIGENTYYWYVSYFSILCGAGIAVPVDKELPNNEIENVIKRSHASAVIFSKKKKDAIDKIKDNLPMVKYFIEMNSDANLQGRDIGIEKVIEEGKKITDSGNTEYMDIEIDPEEFKFLIFTSGTTSQAKGVMLCHRNLAENVNAVSKYVKIYESDRFFSVLPLHHTYESSIGALLPFANGSSVTVCGGLRYIVPDMQEAKPTAMLAVPLLVENLYKKINQTIEKSGKAGLVNSMIHVTNALKGVGIDIKRKVFKEIYDNLGGNMRIIVSAAAPIDKKIGRWVQDIGIEFLQGYGLTETAPIAALTPECDPRVGSVGIPVNCAQIKIHNPNENGEGEIWIKSKTLMLGYYEDEEATKEVVYDGWFNSGDIGYQDKDGYVYVTGRSKNVIVTQNGKNIYPEEIELLLSKIPEIAECMVYGKEVEGEKELIISVKVIPNKEEIERLHGKDLKEEEIHKIIWNKIKEVNKSLTSYKAIKNLELKHDEFAKTTTMKIKRYVELQKDKTKE
ncbi:MAG: AMP-dependent synthetase/ligase [Clostridia bacterium]|jgi:AMP-dependent synthetase/ligase|nr:AMP-binding protein [Clostridium sp.]MEE0127398.1 AMP-binding protein [Clostridia bacterium]